jgi:PmbA protein
MIIDTQTWLAEISRAAQKSGADEVDALFIRDRSHSVRTREGRIDSAETAETASLGLRLILGKQQAIVSTTDLSSRAWQELIARGISMARIAPEDSYCGLAEPAQLSAALAQLDSFDATEPTIPELTDQALAAETSARAVAGVTTIEEAECGWASAEITLQQSNGFHGHYRRSHSSLSVSAIAGSNTAMERDYDWTSAVYRADLKAATVIGQNAGKRAVARLNARKEATGKFPVVFDPRVATSLLGHFLSAVNGAAIARGTSFLKEHLHKRIFPESVQILEDPHRPRGLGSRPFDAEGLPTRPRSLIENGVLTGWLLDLRSARQLGLSSTGNAVRGLGSPPSPAASNVHIAAGTMTPQALLADIKQGFYVTELIGMGVNGVTGDYSRGAAGFWIENGAIAYPVNEMTIAGNLIEMFAQLTAANDLELTREREAPTLRVDGMTVAGV